MEDDSDSEGQPEDEEQDGWGRGERGCNSELVTKLTLFKVN